jgi:hypothetical protein
MSANLLPRNGETLDLYGIRLTRARTTDERVYFSIKTLAEGQIFRTGNHYHRVIRRILPGVYMVAQFKPWGHR